MRRHVDPDAGERVCAVVVSVDPDDPITFDEMVEHLRAAGLNQRKMPERLEAVPSLPRNPAGKVLKHVLRDEFKG